MGRLIDRAADACGRLAALLFFAVGLMITYEVVMRYVFNAPTIWAEEMSRFFQIWATYLAAAHVLRHRHLIVIDVVTQRLGPWARLAVDAVALSAVAAFSAVAVVYGTVIAIDSWELGRATSTMLGVPQVLTETAIPAGFGLLLLQCLAELARLRAGAPGHGRRGAEG